MRSARPYRLLGILVIVALIAAACGAGDDDAASDDASDSTEETTDETSADTSDETSEPATDETTEDTAEPAGDPEPASGFDGETIKLGVLTPQTGLVATIGVPLTAGNQLWYDYINSQGGIAGKYPVELEIADTEYSGDIAVQEYNRLKDDVVAFQQVLGTAVTNAVLPQMERDGKAASPATLDAEWVIEPNLMPLQAPYQIQMINGATWYNTDGGGEGKTACAMIQDDAYGEAGLEGIETAAADLGFELATVARYDATASDFTAQIQQLIDANCEVVYGVLLASSTSSALGKAVELGFVADWILQSPAWLGLFAGLDIIDYLEENVKVIAEGPAWGDESVPGMADLLDRVEQFPPDGDYAGDFYFSFGYNQGRVVTAVLEKAVELGDLSPEGILAAIEQVGTIDFDGLSGDYTYAPIPGRNPSRVSSIYSVDRSMPFGLSMEEQDFSTEAADNYDFGG